MTSTTVTVLGLGAMGKALATAFLGAGHRVTVWNRTAARAEPLVAAGATAAASPADAVTAAPLVVACLIDDRAVHEALDPAAATLSGRTLVDLTSGTPRQARDNAAWAARLGAAYLDGAILTPTPTIGGPAARLLYAGPETMYAAHRPTLDALGGTAVYLGADDVGRAKAYETALLDMFWFAVTGLAHGLALGRAEGIPATDLAPYAQGLAGMLPEMAARFARQAEAGSYPGDRSTIAAAAAGLDHLVETAAEHRIDTGALDASRAIVRRAVAAGYAGDGLGRLVDAVSR